MVWNEEEAVAGIYDAALEPAKWGDALAGVARAIGASSAFFFSTHSDSQPDAVIHTFNHAPEMVGGFTSTWHTEDEWAHAARRTGRMRRGTLVSGAELVPRKRFVRTAFYNEFCREHAIESMLGTVLFDGTEPDPMPFVNLCWYRPPGHAEFGEPEKAKLRVLAPHFQRALQIQRRVGWATDARASQALAALRVASLVLDREGTVHHRDALGESLLRSLPAGCFRFGQLRSLGQRCAPPLAEALSRCDASHPVRLSALQEGLPPRLLRASLLRVEAPSQLVPGDAGERFLLLVELPPADHEQAARAAADLFSLSPAETRMLARLLAGEAPADMSRVLGISLPTVRTQMSSVFAKTGTRGQVELLVLLRNLAR
jgi:DNA-binding CsgD family transcriptional regulator